VVVPVAALLRVAGQVALLERGEDLLPEALEAGGAVSVPCGVGGHRAMVAAASPVSTAGGPPRRRPPAEPR
jgi:hypothetical protein